MSDSARQDAIRTYFTAPEPFLHTRTLVVGACITFLGLVSLFPGDGLGGLLVALLGAAYGALFPFRRKALSHDDPDDADVVSLVRYRHARERFEAREEPDTIRAWLDEAIGRIRDASFDRLGLYDTCRDPVCVVGPLYTPSVDGVSPDVVLRRNAHEGNLYSTYRITVFQFTTTFLGVYRCTYNLMEDKVADERMAEVFYRDVSAVQITTETSNQVLKNGERLTRATVFSLAAHGGESVRMVIDDPAIRAGDDLRARTDEAVMNVRAMLREQHSTGDEA